jgi:hypothetical protein
LHSPDSVPVTWIALVIVEPGLAGIPVTDVMVIEQAITNSSRWRAIGFRKTIQRNQRRRISDQLMVNKPA